MIRFNCGCGREIQVGADKAGRKGKCPACGELVSIPTHPDLATQSSGDLPVPAPPPPTASSNSAAPPSPPLDRAQPLTPLAAVPAADGSREHFSPYWLILVFAALISAWGVGANIVNSLTKNDGEMATSTVIGTSCCFLGFILSCGFLQVIGAIERASAKK